MRIPRHGLAIVLSLLVLAISAGPAHADDSLVERYLGRNAGTTTDLRREYKTTVPKEAAASFLAAVADHLGPVTLRDEPRAGGANLNDTDYLDTGEALWDVLGYRSLPPEGSISPKIRIRAYVERDASGRERKAVITKGQSFLELKIPHPTLAGVSLKPRLIVNNRHLEVFLERDRLADPRNRAQLAASLKADSRNDPETVDDFLAVFDALHQAHRGDTLRPWLNTRYARQAYVLPIRDRAGKAYDLQLTVDRDVEYRKPGGSRIGRYAPAWRAVEVKVPIELADMSEADLRARGLDQVIDLRQLQAKHLESSRTGGITGGKAGAFRVLLSKRNQRRLTRARFRPARAARAPH